MNLNAISPAAISDLQAELNDLNNTFVEVDGRQLKAGDCYYFGTNPVHLLYNTNCPDTLKIIIEKIIAKYSD